MKQTTIVLGLATLLASSSVGCKSAPKMAWWKSKDAAGSTAMAHQAPELPSDAAKKAEAKTQVAGGGVAAPFTPGAATGSAPAANSNYPTTDAPAFTPSAVAQTTPTAGAAGPYNPAATPVGKAAPVTVATTGAERYGASDPAAAVQQGLASGYAATNEAANGVAGSVADVASRYGMPPAGDVPVSTGVAAVTPYSPAPVTQASSVVATQPYRPGGTSTYAVPSVASLPGSTTPTATTTPTTTTAPATTPTSNRYW